MFSNSQNTLQALLLTNYGMSIASIFANIDPVVTWVNSNLPVDIHNSIG